MNDENNIEMPQTKSGSSYQNGGQFDIPISAPNEVNYQQSKQMDIPIITNNNGNTFYKGDEVIPQQVHGLDNNQVTTYKANQQQAMLTNQDYGTPHVNYDKEVKSLVEETSTKKFDIKNMNQKQKDMIYLGLVFMIAALVIGGYYIMFFFGFGSVQKEYKYADGRLYLAFYDKGICSINGNQFIDCSYSVVGSGISIVYTTYGSEYSRRLDGIVKSNSLIYLNRETIYVNDKDTGSKDVSYNLELTEEKESDTEKPLELILVTTTTSTTSANVITTNAGISSGYAYYDMEMKKDLNKSAEVVNYATHSCPTKYYSNSFYIENNTLYAKIEPDNTYTDNLTGDKVKVLDNVGRVFSVKMHNCGLEYIFASGLDGTFYYINNLTISSLNTFAASPVNIKYITGVATLEVDGKYVIEYTDFTDGLFYTAVYEDGISVAE